LQDTSRRRCPLLPQPPQCRSYQLRQKPNILVIMADDIGYWNISAYNRGTMGYVRPTSSITLDLIDVRPNIFGEAIDSLGHKLMNETQQIAQQSFSHNLRPLEKIICEAGSIIRPLFLWVSRAIQLQQLGTAQEAIRTTLKDIGRH
jgi:hypothetical protein